MTHCKRVLYFEGRIARGRVRTTHQTFDAELGSIMTASSTQHPGTVIVEDANTFAALEEEWEDLYHDCPLATPFQSWAWLYSWWEFYGEHYELRLVTIRNEEGLLVGILPLMLERRRTLGKLLFIGSGPTDYLDVLAREG